MRTFSCTTATAMWHSSRSSTSQLRLPSPSTLRKTETSFRCSEAYSLQSRRNLGSGKTMLIITNTITIRFLL